MRHCLASLNRFSAICSCTCMPKVMKYHQQVQMPKGHPFMFNKPFHSFVAVLNELELSDLTEHMMKHIESTTGGHSAP